jgi:hypothetical protein
MDKNLVEAFVQECREEQEWKERWKANHIEFDNYFKYSGEVEPNTPEYNEYLTAKEYDFKFATMPVMDKMRPRNIYLLLTPDEGAIVDCFYKYSDELNMEDMATKTGWSKDFFKKTISKHLKIMRDDKNNAIRGLPRLKKLEW